MGGQRIVLLAGAMFQYADAGQYHTMNPIYHQYLDTDQYMGQSVGRFLNKMAEAAAKKIAALCQTHRVSLALSFGKDSMTLLHICHRFNLIDHISLIMWNNSGIESHDTLGMRDYVLSVYPEMRSRYVETVPASDPYEYLAAFDGGSLKPLSAFVSNCLEKTRWDKFDEYEIDGVILGLRKQESLVRLKNYRLRGERYYNKREEAVIITPLINWGVEHIFAYAASEGIPLHPIYGRSHRLGFDRGMTRVNTLASLDMARYGAMVHVKMLYPDEFRQMCDRIPMIANMV
ncbi:MAG: phosphoadenosine phosphosulfate reductase family protein [Acidithiobacillus sp.]|nr:phosphoadenosine phosphosulfate reductase family protein [Acidithiobacillus sp.]